LIVDEKSITVPWTGNESAFLVGINPNFPVRVTQNTMYSFADYVTTVGGQYSIVSALILFLAQKFLYPAITEDLADELTNEEIRNAESLSLTLETTLTREKDMEKKKAIIVNKYLNWYTILR